ncbi:ArsC family transcriptional regulator [Allostella vacuolata]|nr:ArsC family transcriptional regulator [Stella vacuolata]
MRRPASVLFACTQNSVRSPMAEAILKQLQRSRIFVDSAGLRSEPIDPFAIVIMAEIGLDLSRHRSKSFDELEDTSFDLIVTLSPEAHHRALEMTRTMAVDVEYWPTFDPTIVEGSRPVRLEAYRAVRDGLWDRIAARFPGLPTPAP